MIKCAHCKKDPGASGYHNTVAQVRLCAQRHAPSVDLSQGRALLVPEPEVSDAEWKARFAAREAEQEREAYEYKMERDEWLAEAQKDDAIANAEIESTRQGYGY